MINTELYIDALTTALQGVYEGEEIPVLEGPAERVLALMGESYSDNAFISVIDETTDYEPGDGYDVLQTQTDLRIEVYVMMSPNEQTDDCVRLARTISDYVVFWLMKRSLTIAIATGGYTTVELQPINRERVTEETVLDGHYAITARMIATEYLTC